MDDGQTPAALAPVHLARTEGSPQPTGSEMLKGRGLKCRETPGALHTVIGDYPAVGAESKAWV